MTRAEARAALLLGARFWATQRTSYIDSSPRRDAERVLVLGFGKSKHVALVDVEIKGTTYIAAWSDLSEFSSEFKVSR